MRRSMSGNSGSESAMARAVVCSGPYRWTISATRSRTTLGRPSGPVVMSQYVKVWSSDVSSYGNSDT
jgi:hypothetical protein